MKANWEFFWDKKSYRLERRRTGCQCALLEKIIYSCLNGALYQLSQCFSRTHRFCFIMCFLMTCLFSRWFVGTGRASTKWVNISLEFFRKFCKLDRENPELEDARATGMLWRSLKSMRGQHDSLNCLFEEHDDPVNPNLKRSASERKGWFDSTFLCDMICLDDLWSTDTLHFAMPNTQCFFPLKSKTRLLAD